MGNGGMGYVDARTRLREAIAVVKLQGLSGTDIREFIEAMVNGFKAAYDLLERFPDREGTYLLVRTYLIESAAAGQSWMARNSGKPPN